MKFKVFSKIRFFFLIYSVMIFSACHDSDKIEPEYGERTVLIYMAADNNLNKDGETNIKSILKGMEQTAGRLVIYIDPRYDVPRLLTVKGGKGCRLDTLETYTEENSASPEVLARVVKEVQKRYPASSYGLVLWSHGLGWVPPEYSFPGGYAMRLPDPDMPRTKYYAEDEHPRTTGKAYMDIREMAARLPGHFNFILWDVCFMGGIEVAYELRNKTDYMIASPAEVISDGFPYEKIVPLLWGGEEAMKQICREYYNHYNKYPVNSLWRSAVVGLVKTGELEPLAAKVRTLLAGKTDYARAWHYPLNQGGLPMVFFDFGDYIRKMTTEEEYNSFKKLLDRVVIYKAATEKLFGDEVPADKFSGLTSYIPFSEWSDMNTYYYTLDWGATVYENN